MSPSYVVWYTPHSRLIIWLSPSPSDPLDDLAPEEPVRPDHQSEDHEDVGQKVLGAPAHVGIDVARGHALDRPDDERSEEHTSELQSPCNLVCRLLLEKKKKKKIVRKR